MSCSVNKDPRICSRAACSPWAQVMAHSEPRADPACPQAHCWNAQAAHGLCPKMAKGQARAALHTEGTRPTHQLATYVSTCVQLEIGQ